MCQDRNGNEDEVDFKDETLDRSIAEISRLQALISVEEERLLKAMREATQLKKRS
jgi:hypothetical protein